MLGKPLNLNDYTLIARERALTDAESAEVDRLLNLARIRQRNLPLRILRMRANLRAIEAQLLPEQARWLGSMQESIDRGRAARIEQEMRDLELSRARAIDRERRGYGFTKPMGGSNNV